MEEGKNPSKEHWKIEKFDIQYRNLRYDTINNVLSPETRNRVLLIVRIYIYIPGIFIFLRRNSPPRYSAETATPPTGSWSARHPRSSRRTPPRPYNIQSSMLFRYVNTPILLQIASFDTTPNNIAVLRDENKRTINTWYQVPGTC